MRSRALSLVLLLCGSSGASAHHSFGAHYFEDQLVSIRGEVTSFDYRSPHAWLHVLVRDDGGVVRRVSLEWANPRRLQQTGVTEHTLKPGDLVLASGSPGRNAAEHKIHLKRIERPADGWRWSGGRRR